MDVDDPDQLGTTEFTFGPMTAPAQPLARRKHRPSIALWPCPLMTSPAQRLLLTRPELLVP